MIRRVALALSLTSLAAVLAAAANLPDHWRSWRYSRPILQNSASPENSPAGNPAEFRLPWELFAHCNAGCSDLRIVDAQGQEVPYELKTDRARAHSESYEARILENSFAAGKFTQVVGDLGRDAPFYDRVRVETTQPDFIVWAEVSLSDDAKTWRIVETRAPIARFRKHSVDGTQTISFQGLNSRYIRVRIFEAEAQFGVTGLTVFREESHPATLAEVPATFQLATSDDTAETAWTADLAVSRVPVSRLQFVADTPEFYRAVRIADSADGKLWNYRGSGVIYRYNRAATTRESLTVDFPEWPENHLVRVEVINGNDQPLHNARLTLLAFPRVVLFRPQPNTEYRILYGNEGASSPQYDLSHFLETEPSKLVYLNLSLGPEENTSNYRDPRPFSERHPEVLWISLGIAIVLIGFTALKTLRTPNPSSQNSPS
jgi:Protein of unknown function (DUF3999)